MIIVLYLSVTYPFRSHPLSILSWFSALDFGCPSLHFVSKLLYGIFYTFCMCSYTYLSLYILHVFIHILVCIFCMYSYISQFVLFLCILTYLSLCILFVFIHILVCTFCMYSYISQLVHFVCIHTYLSLYILYVFIHILVCPFPMNLYMYFVKYIMYENTTLTGHLN